MRSILRQFGSLWFAAAILVLLLVAMACATVYESTHGREQALFDFYHAWWFEWLLGLLGLSVLASMIVRYPFSKRQFGFVLTHSGIVAVLIGAWITQRFGLDGQVGILEQQSIDAFSLPVETLTFHNQSTGQTRQFAIGDAAGGFRVREHADPKRLKTSGPSIQVLRYLPDSTPHRQVHNDLTEVRHAVHISVGPGGQHEHERVWLFENNIMSVGQKKVVLRAVHDADELQRLISETQGSASGVDGVVRLAIAGQSVSIPLKECLNQPVPVADTGFRLRVLRYLPHAIVGEGNTLLNLSDRPVNPAIEVELIGAKGSDRRVAFANFPDFQSMHPQRTADTIKITFQAPKQAAAEADIEILASVEKDLHIRFHDGSQIENHRLDIGQAVDAPWSGLQLVAHDYYEHARIKWVLEAVAPIRDVRQPAILVKMQMDQHAEEVWLKKHRSRTINLDGVAYEIQYGDKSIALGFELKLNRFHLGYYPGGSRPRSFESHVTVIDPAAGHTLDRVISMNHPMKYNGFSFYQSSYRMDGEQTATYLSVSKDPGLAVVYLGYISTILGMIIVLGIRMADRRATQRSRQVIHLQVGGTCQE